ncbi:methyltransferase [Streptomyces sp. NPDC085929]|uniref:methyltransferase n=1 Tax=Streptomyces sp. NPDC085929 TaxID=3365739 RepID=UPI0037D04B34
MGDAGRPDTDPNVVDMMRLLRGFQVSQALYVLAKCRLPDRLVDGPLPMPEAAAVLGLDEDALRRVIRVAVAVGALTLERDERVVALTPLGATLATQPATSVRQVALMLMETQYVPFGGLWDTMQHGRPTPEAVLGMPFFDWLATQQDGAATFTAAMAEMTHTMRYPAVAALDLDGVDHLVDVGGADGTVLAALAGRYPQLRGTVFDLPHVVASAADVLRSHSVANRIGTVGGDFFVSVPADADCYLLANVLHDWGDEEARRILRVVHDAAPPGGRLLLIELVLGVGTARLYTSLMDLTMLTLFGGRERTEAEWRMLLTSVGFRFGAIRPTGGPFCVLEATR